MSWDSRNLLLETPVSAASWKPTLCLLPVWVWASLSVSAWCRQCCWAWLCACMCVCVCVCVCVSVCSATPSHRLKLMFCFFSVFVCSVFACWYCCCLLLCFFSFKFFHILFVSHPLKKHSWFGLGWIKNLRLVHSVTTTVFNTIQCKMKLRKFC